MKDNLKKFFETLAYSSRNSSDSKFKKIRQGQKEAVIIGCNGWSINWTQFWLQQGFPIKAMVNLEGTQIQEIDPKFFINFDELSAEKHIAIICVPWDLIKPIEENLLQRGIEYLGWENVDGARYMPHFETNIIYENIDKIYSAYSLMADDPSREIFLSLIRYRLTHNETELLQSTHQQYFHPIVRAKENDVVIEAGGLDGGTAKQVLKSVGGGV